jgi:DNA-binding PucR family transcriptional regulator
MGLPLVKTILGQFFEGAHRFDGALLKLYGIASRGHGNADQTFGEVDVAVVVDANLRTNKAWLIVADQSVVNPYRSHEKTLLEQSLLSQIAGQEQFSGLRKFW